MLLIRDLILPNDKRLNFELSRGEFMIIHGPNGSGKSLLLKSIALLERARFGDFVFQGRPIQEWAATDYRSRVLYVPSATHNLDMEVREYLELPYKLAIYQEAGLSGDEAIKRAQQLNLMGKKLGILSMGQRQILSLIRAVNLRAQVLLLDEPTSHLDPQMILTAHRLLQEWKEKSGGSIVMVGHNEDEAATLGVRGKQFNDFLI